MNTFVSKSRFQGASEFPDAKLDHTSLWVPQECDIYKKIMEFKDPSVTCSIGSQFEDVASEALTVIISKTSRNQRRAEEREKEKEMLTKRKK
jgi:hypothetical protein